MSWLERIIQSLMKSQMLHPGVSIDTRLHLNSVCTPTASSAARIWTSSKQLGVRLKCLAVLFRDSGTDRRASHPRGGFQRFAMGSNVSGIKTLQRGNQQGFHRLRSSPKGQEPCVDGKALAQVCRCVSCRHNGPVLERSALPLWAMLPSAVRGSAEEQLPTLTAGGRACCSLKGPGAGGCAWGMLGRSGQNLQPTGSKNNRRKKLQKLILLFICIATYIRRESETEENGSA